MWHGAASFEKHERVLRRGDIGTAAGEFIGECEHIINGIIAAKAEFKACFTILGTMAGAHITAQLASDGHDVAHIVWLQRQAHACDAHRNSGRFPHEGDLGLSLAILDRT